ncbi:MAG: antitoxin VapB family protein [Methanomicrobia archaeon]|nr:antitoxin VapB family protein [Methanomicrobia archaeon]MCK4432808.1 antitoxin VapB family protein [Methanomicrobia archaeon]MCK4636442.1 antitoxin VapB family protein [Methanomicrobia archaeon]
MGTKTISIKDSVYEILKRSKKEDESFSDVIERLAKEKNIDFMSFFGGLKDKEVLDSIEKDSKKIRELSKVRL